MITDKITDAGLYRLMTWLSPGFPVGGYSHSHGIEYAVEEGLITDAETLIRWLGSIVSEGAGRMDAMFFRAAWQAVADDDPETLSLVAEKANAMRATSETALESTAQGQAFVDTLLATWPEPRFGKWVDVVAAQRQKPAYAVAVGIAAAVAEVPVRQALIAFLHAFTANLISAGVRLVPLGQTDGQKALVALEAPVQRTAGQALSDPFETLGAAVPMVDWTSMKHETQYTRLFRS